MVQEKLQQLQEQYEERVKKEGIEKKQTGDVLKYYSTINIPFLTTLI